MLFCSITTAGIVIASFILGRVTNTPQPDMLSLSNNF